MAIHRIKRFSSDIENDESQKKEPDPKDGLGKDLIKSGIVTGATIYGVKKGRDDLNHYLSRKSKDIKYDKKENKELFKKLKRITKKQKTAVISSNIGEYSTIINKNERKEILDELRKTKKFRKKVKEGKKDVGDFINKFGKTREADTIKDLKKHNKRSDKATKEYINELKNRLNSIDSIHTPNNSASTLAHELGHSKYYKNRSNGFGRKIHKLSDIITRNDMKDTAIISSSFASGINSYIDKVQGKKESKVSKYMPIISSVVMKTPTLLSEACASYEGHRKLKDLGASDEFLKNYKKDLGYCLGTYATGILTDTGKGYVARQAGKLLGRGSHALSKYYRNKNKNKNKEED